MLPNLAAEVAFWQNAFGLDAWTITARHARRRSPPLGALIGVVDEYDTAKRSATIVVAEPRTNALRRAWSSIVCHEMLHLVFRDAGIPWSHAQKPREHAVIERLDTLLADMKKRCPEQAAKVGGVFAGTIRLTRKKQRGELILEADMRAALRIPSPDSAEVSVIERVA